MAFVLAKCEQLFMEVLQGVISNPNRVFFCMALQHLSKLWHFIQKAMYLITHTHTHTHTHTQRGVSL